MADGRKRSRCSNWSHEETMLLAELKREAFLNKEEGGLAWKQIAQTISSRFPDQMRSDDQCRRRWDTLRKDYNHIEEYCIETGQDHWQLDEEELTSMKLDTAYRQDWYNIVKKVCSQRKRKERGDYDLIAVKQSKRLDSGSHSAVFPERTPRRDTLYVTPPASISEPVIRTRDTHHEQSTTVNAQVCTQPSLEVEKLSPEEEILRLKREKDALILELVQMRQRVQLTEQDQSLEPTDQVLQTFPAEVRAQVKEPLEDGVLDGGDDTVEPSSKVEQDGTGSELMVPRSRSLSPECSSHGQHLGEMNFAEGKGSVVFDTFTCFSPPLSVPAMGFRDHIGFPVGFSELRLEPGRSTFIASRTSSRSPGSRVSDRTISGQSSECNVFIELVEELDSNSGMQCVSKRSRLLQRPWCVLKPFVWACVHFSSSLRRIRQRNQMSYQWSLLFTLERNLGKEDIAGNNMLSAAFGPPALPDSMSNGLMPGEGLNENGLFQRNTGWSAMTAATPPRRTFTKVHKLGSVDRSLDVRIFSNYTELRMELAQKFHLDYQLIEDPSKSGWRITFVDNENDTLLLGDDPWEEFLSCVRYIKILSPKEVAQISQEQLQILDTVPMRLASCK